MSNGIVGDYRFFIGYGIGVWSEYDAVYDRGEA